MESKLYLEMLVNNTSFRTNLKRKPLFTKQGISAKFKVISYLMIVMFGAMPWNATAINIGSLSDKLIQQSAGHNAIETLLAKTLLEISGGKTKQAFNTINELIRTAPNYKLAYLIRGDLLTSQGRPLTAFGAPTASLNEDGVSGLRDEARVRMGYYLSTKNRAKVPNLLIELDESQSHLIVVDTKQSRLFLYKKTDSGLKYLSDYYVTIGKNGADKQIAGDKRTPLGVYFASAKLKTSLPDFYGDGAYPLNYPNELDQQQNKKGSGIWLHGTSHNTYSRPPRASDGCIVLSNPDLKALGPILEKGNTPVIIADDIDWVDGEQVNLQSSTAKSLKNTIEDWRRDWASQNTEAYLSHYSKKFFYSGGGLQKWSDYKRQIQAAKPKVNVGVDDVSMFGFPNYQEQVVVVNFEQAFESALLKNKMRKRQYWINENNQWKIIYEGAS
jgi:murein L,D-transpeptidase YafK